MHRFSFPLILALALLLGLVALWMAHEEWEAYERSELLPVIPDREAIQADLKGILSLQEIVRRLKLPEESRILEVEREEKDGKLYYEIEFLDRHGKVQELYVDPSTAEVVVLEEEEEAEEAHHETAAGGR